MTPYRRLLDLFRARFFENDAVTPEGGFETNIYQVMGLLGVPGWFISQLLMPAFLRLSMQPPSPAADAALRAYRLFFPAYSFAVIGFATVFEWDMLFPDRRDFLILGAFPIRLRTLFAAKFSALGLFLLLLISAGNGFITLTVPLFSMAMSQAREAGYLRLFAAQIAATAGASMFAFFSVAAFQGLLINVTSPRVFRRISPWIQVAGMCLMILSVALFPVYSLLLPSAARTNAQWLWFLPPVWFSGMYDLLLPHVDPLFASLGRFGLQALAGAAAVFAVAWSVGFRRHHRRTLEAEDTESRAPRRSLYERFLAPAEEHAIFHFTSSILGRSAKHRLFLATYWSVGISIGLFTTIVVRNGQAGVSLDGLRSLPLLIIFFVVSGFRAAFQFPAELASNWQFRITEERWAEISRRATRKIVLAHGLIPGLLLMLPLEMAYWGAPIGLFHSIFQLAAGALLIEVLFWNFGKVPFTCSYFPGKVNLAILSVIYLYGFTTYSFQMADLEAALEGHAVRALLFFAAAGAALTLLWRRHPAAATVLFDANEPEIQTLDLT